MRNIISVQLERPSCSESLMVYSKCLMNIRMWTPARNTDLSESRSSNQKHQAGPQLQQKQENTCGKNDTSYELCNSYGNYAKKGWENFYF